MLSALSAIEVSVEDALLAALAAAWQRWTDQELLFIDIEHHGREDISPGIDLSRTVGWFTTFTPVAISTNHRSGMRALLTEIHGQLRAIPQRGFGYGILRYLSRDPAVQSLLCTSDESNVRPAAPEVALNYLGRLDRRAGMSRFNLVDDANFPIRDPRNIRSHVLELSASIVNDALHVNWFYSEYRHRLSSVRMLVTHFNNALQELIADCKSKALTFHALVR